MKELPRRMNEYGDMVTCGHDAQDGETPDCGACPNCRAEARREGRKLAPIVAFRDEPRGPPCAGCDGTGTCSDGHMNDPRSREVDCDDCDGSGLACEKCRFSKHGLCGECGLEQVEAFYE